MKNFSIIIPTYERKEVFEKTIVAAHEAIEGINAEIIVVNDSKIQEIHLPFNSPKIISLKNPGKGVASARNFGAARAQSDILIFLDDDILISKQAIKKLEEHLLNDKKNCYLLNWSYPPELVKKLKKSKFGRYLEKYNFVTLKGWLGDQWQEAEEIFELQGGASYCLPITKSNFNKIGGYNESFPHAGAEDYEFSERAKKAGTKFYLDKSVEVYHNEEDRLILSNWLARKKRNGETIRLASEIGYKELRFYYSPLKKNAYYILSKIKPIIHVTYNSIPNLRIFDIISFKCINLLLGIYLFEGYHKK